MADLLVRGVDEALVRALEARAGERGRSAEAEHREILAAALAQPRRRSFAEVLASMPEVGTDADFERIRADEGSEPAARPGSRIAARFAEAGLDEELKEFHARAVPASGCPSTPRRPRKPR